MADKPKEEPKVEAPKVAPKVEKPKEEPNPVVLKVDVKPKSVVPKVEAPLIVPEWKKCNRCKTEMVEESKDGFEIILKCPKCGSKKSKC